MALVGEVGHLLREREEAGRIKLWLKDCTENLLGQVQTRGEERAVVEAASHAPGVQGINDHLNIAS